VTDDGPAPDVPPELPPRPDVPQPERPDEIPPPERPDEIPPPDRAFAYAPARVASWKSSQACGWESRPGRHRSAR
jgi:hypothetical protein